MVTSISVNSPSTIHLALSPWDLSDDYNRHAGVTLISFLDHCNKNTHVVAHLLYDDKLSAGKERETEYNKSCYQKIAEQYNCTVIFHPIELPEWVDDVPCLKKWTAGSLMRLCLPKILPEANKVIYLDCDMVVTTNVEKLWNIVLDDYYLAAVPDSLVSKFGRKRRNYCKQKNIPIERYFCSGTLVLNLKKLRDEKKTFEKNVFDYLQENKNLPFPDQDMLNWFCQGNYLTLEEKYNIYSNRIDAMEYIEDGIIHYASSWKPWKRYGGEIDNPYWNYLLETPWCATKLDVLKYAQSAPDILKSLNILPQYIYAQNNLPPYQILKNSLICILNILKTLVKCALTVIEWKLIKMKIL